MKQSITAVILAGGRGNRMHQQDKGLVQFKHRPLIEWIIAGLSPQVGHIIINANRNIERYTHYGLPVIRDEADDFQGPLAGIQQALTHATTPYVLTVPCDAPVVSPALVARLAHALHTHSADVAVVHDGKRLQPTYALISIHARPVLQTFLASGQRKLAQFYRNLNTIEVGFSDCAADFRNMNTEIDKYSLEHSLPIMGFCAYSGTGKTTLLTRLIPVLKARGVRLAVIKHTHHVIDLDKPGKDSYRVREAGAQQVILASHQRIFSLHELPQPQSEAKLLDALKCIAPTEVDLVLVEGFKHEAFAKIELHRPLLNKPIMYPEDKTIVAVASDDPTHIPPHPVSKLDINNIEQIADFVMHFTRPQSRTETKV